MYLPVVKFKELFQLSCAEIEVRCAFIGFKIITQDRFRTQRQLQEALEHGKDV